LWHHIVLLINIMGEYLERLLISRVSNIPRQMAFHAMSWNSPFAVENYGIACILPHLYLIPGFFSDSFLISLFAEQQNLVVSLLGDFWLQSAYAYPISKTWLYHCGRLYMYNTVMHWFWWNTPRILAKFAMGKTGILLFSFCLMGFTVHGHNELSIAVLARLSVLEILL